MDPTAIGKHEGYHCLGQLSPGMQSLVLNARNDDPQLEHLRQVLLIRRNTAIRACFLEIGVSMGAMALYDLRRTILVPIMNTVLVCLCAIGLHGALTLSLRRIQIHAIVTTGLITACILNFFCEALLTETGMGSDILPNWAVLSIMLVPYSINLACSFMSILLGSVLSDYLQMEDVTSGLPSSNRIEEQAEQLKGQDVCCVCMDARKNAVLTPCGHRAVCERCADMLQARERKCPICRQAISGFVKVWDT